MLRKVKRTAGASKLISLGIELQRRRVGSPIDERSGDGDLPAPHGESGIDVQRLERKSSRENPAVQEPDEEGLQPHAPLP